MKLRAQTANIFRPKSEGEVCCCQLFKWGSNCPSCLGVGIEGGYDLVGAVFVEEVWPANNLRIESNFPILVGDLFLWKDTIQQIREVQIESFAPYTFRAASENLHFTLDNQNEAALRERFR